MNFGEFIRKRRQELKKSLEDLSKESNIDIALLSKFENNLRRPSPNNLEKLLTVLELSEKDIHELLVLGNYINKEKTVGEDLAHVPSESKSPEFHLLNSTVPIAAYSDAIAISINPHGVILDFFQTVGGVRDQRIIASRVGISKEHASVLIEKLSAMLKKDRLNQEKLKEVLESEGGVAER